LARQNNDYAELWLTLEYLADCLYRTGAADEALRTATMGVSIGQQLNRCKGYYSDTEVAAGDVGCRLIRARIHLDREQWDEAEKDLRLARVLAEHSSYSGHLKAIERLEQDLSERRRERPDHAPR